MPADAAELARIRRLVHSLACRDGLSVTETAARLTAYRIERSAADIERDLRLAGCESCGRRAASQPQAEPDEPVRPVIHRTAASGFLTGMIERDG